MFEAAERGCTVSREDFAARVPELRAALLEAQFELRSARFPVIVVIAGADGAGKGDTVNRLHEWLDPRGVETHAFGDPSDEEQERPPYWRFWRTLPAAGRIGVFFGSWYTGPILRRAYREAGAAEFERELGRIAAFERTLADGGALILKFWFHLAKKEQRRRLRRLARHRRTRWRVGDLDWKHLGLYDRFVPASEHALRATDAGHAPWTIVEATDARHRDLLVGETLLAALQARLAAPAPTVAAAPVPVPAVQQGPGILERVDLSATMSADEFARRRDELQGRFNRLTRRALRKGRSNVLVLEGWDASGKGGAIRRLTEAMDARWYRVIPVAAPNDEERAHHWLWRFWRHLPRAGRVAIFDRSWYGRVLVERVEGFAQPGEWARAYHEITEFEQQLVDVGAVVTKFWVHVDPDEQLRRFEARKETAWKRHKITDEDWRNRSRWPAYAAAVDEMVARTSTADAPWILVPGNDKRVARLSVLSAACDRLEAALG